MVRRTLLASLPALAGALHLGASTIPRPSPEFAINMGNNNELLLSKFRGKVVVLWLLSTTCKHCQQLTQVLNDMQREYGPRGVQVLGAAFNPMSHMLVPEFITQFKPAFPVGSSTREPVVAYLERPLTLQTYVPILVFIDRQGVVRRQVLGDDPFFNDDRNNLKVAIESLLNQPVVAPPAKPVPKTSSRKK